MFFISVANTTIIDTMCCGHRLVVMANSYVREVMQFYRARGGLVSQFVDTDMGHCEHSERAVQYTAAFVAAAAKARIPASASDASAPVKVSHV